MLSCAVVQARDIEVEVRGKGDNAREALLAAIESARPGDVIRLRSGRYAMDRRIDLNGSGASGRPIRLEPLGEGRIILDFSSQGLDGNGGGLRIRGQWWHLKDVEVIGAGGTGIQIAGGGHNILERCAARQNRFTGIALVHEAHHNLVVDCEASENYDPQNHGEHADGFSASGLKLGEGNVFRNCRAWGNSDDGFDLWQAPRPVRLENCVAAKNGVNAWKDADFQGDGNGFKLGGRDVGAAHVVVDCVAADHPAAGFAQNGNLAGQTLERCIAINCRWGFVFSMAPKTGQHTLLDNLSYNSASHLAPGTVERNNRWIVMPPSKP